MKNLIKKSLVLVLSIAMVFSFSMPAKTKADSYTAEYSVGSKADINEVVGLINDAGSGNYLISLEIVTRFTGIQIVKK